MKNVLHLCITPEWYLSDGSYSSDTVNLKWDPPLLCISCQLYTFLSKFMSLDFYYQLIILSSIIVAVEHTTL
jgi:hypothetical protein